MALISSHPSNNSHLHHYAALESNEHIRVIVLEPSADSSSPLRFSFEQDRLGELQDSYEAISYTWGEAIFDHTLCSVDDTFEIAITKSLHSALCRFRDVLQPRRLWADAVCINQKDDHEKSQQIPLMRHIYREARRVLVWLGDGEKEQEAIPILARFSRQVRQYGREDIQLSRQNHETARRVVRAFFLLPWFSRRWIIQEIALNSDVVFFMSQQELPLVRLIRAVGMMEQDIPPGSSDYILSSRASALNAMFSLWRYWSEGALKVSRTISDFATQNIFEMMETFEQSACVDARDKIYALGGLASNVEIRSTETSSRGRAGIITLEARYNVDFQVVYLVFATSAISSGYGLDVLSAACIRMSDFDRSTLPSWVPDWTKARSHFPFSRISGPLEETQFPSLRSVKATFDTNHFRTEKDVSGKETRSTLRVKSLFQSNTKEHCNLYQIIYPLLQFVKSTAGCHDASKNGDCGLQWLSVRRLHKLWRALGINRDELEMMYESLSLAKDTGFESTDEETQKRHDAAAGATAFDPLEKDLMSKFWSLFYNRSVFCTNTYSVPRDLDEKITYYGVGSVAVRPGDTVLVPSTEGKSTRPWLQAFLLRPREEDPGSKNYHLVGFALLMPFLTSYWTVKPGGDRWYLHSPNSRYPCGFYDADSVAAQEASAFSPSRVSVRLE